MNAIVPANFGPISKVFANQPVENELGAGIQGGFGMIGYKGKVWSIRKGGEELPLMREDGDGPRASIEVVVVKAAQVVSKIFYESGYVEGSTAAPDCYSTNGVTPAAGAAKKQCNACSACPKNAWGSRVTPAGKQGKACSDSKRLAVVPLGDLRNEAFGGPLLLRIPAASLGDLRNFGDKMSALGYPSGSYGVRVSFDHNESYPKFVFNAIRPLTDVEAAIVMELRGSPETTRVLADDEHAPVQRALPAPGAAPFEQMPNPQPVAANTGGVTLQPAAPQPMIQNPVTQAPQTPQAPKVVPFPGTGVASTQPVQPAASVLQGAPVSSASTSASSVHDTAAHGNTPSPAGGVPTAVSENEAAPTGVEDFDAKLDALLA